MQVVAAMIIADGRLLLAQRTADRDYPFHWECPGGKVETGESPQAALARELEEELGLDHVIVDDEPWFVTVFDPPVSAVTLTLSFYRVQMVVPDCPEPDDVVGFGWFRPEEMEVLRLCPGNVRLVAALKEAGLPEPLAWTITTR